MTRRAVPHSKSLATILRAVGDWWTTDHWSGSADLALKLLGILALVGAFSFFTTKPDIRSFWTCYPKIDLESVQAFYAGNSSVMPAPVVQAIRDENESLRKAVIRPQTSQAEYLLTQRHSFCVPVPVASPASSDKLSGENRRLLYELFYVEGGSQSEDFPQAPQYALGLASRLSPEELSRAINSIERSRSWVFTLTVKNYDAHAVAKLTIAPPAGAALLSPPGGELTLQPGALTRVDAETPVGGGPKGHLFGHPQNRLLAISTLR